MDKTLYVFHCITQWASHVMGIVSETEDTATTKAKDYCLSATAKDIANRIHVRPDEEVGLRFHVETMQENYEG